MEIIDFFIEFFFRKKAFKRFYFKTLKQKYDFYEVKFDFTV